LPKRASEGRRVSVQISNLQDFGGRRAGPTISDILRRDIDEFADRFRARSELLRRARNGALSPDLVGRYLRSLQYLIRNTIVHLSLAEARAKALGQDDLAAHFAAKRSEEQGHDRWAEADIARLCERFVVAVPDEPSPGIVAIVEANTRIVHDEPRVYLAYMLFAEYITVVLGPEWLSALADKCGIPVDYMTVVDKHVELDKDHATEGCMAIDDFFDASPSDAARVALRGMMERFTAFCDGLCADVTA
jgi:hypothetical protein